MRFLNQLFLLVLVIPLLTEARSITGRVTTLSGQPIQYASLAVLDDSTFVGVTTTDSCGIFSYESLELKRPVLRVAMLGYERIDTVIHDLSQPIDIVLKQSESTMLDEIEIYHTPPAVTLKSDVIVTNIAGSALQRVGSATDVLRNVSLISVNQDETLEVFGRGTPIVYIDGRKINDFRQLQQLKSEDIRSVEVITNPGSKYSSDVMAVVIIRTIRRRGEGFSASVGASESYDRHFGSSANLDIRYRTKGLEVFAEGNYSGSKHAYTTGNDQWSTELGETLRQNAFSDRLATMFWLSAKTGFSYMPAENHSFGAFYNYGFWRKYESLDNTQTITRNNIDGGKWLMFGNDTTLSAPTHNINLYYSGSVSNFNIDFNADYYERSNIHNFKFDETSPIGDQYDILIKNHGKSRMFAEKLVAAYDFTGSTIELGEEYTHSTISSSSVNHGAPFAGNAIKVKESNFAPFAEFRRSWSNLSVSAGLRYEYVVNEFRQGNDNYKRSTYSNLFPSLSVGWKIYKTNLSLSFTNKSVRPSYAQLSDILEYSTRTKYWRGNPALVSEKYYNVQLSASWKWLFGQVMYIHTTDAIFQTYEPYEENPEVSLITYRNVPFINAMQANLGFRHNIGRWSPNITLAVTKQWHHINTTEGKLDLSAPIGRIQFGNSFSFPANWMAYISFDFTSGGNSHNHSYKAHHSLDASISKSLFNDDMIFTLSVQDIFGKSFQRYSIYNEIGRIDCLDTWSSRSARLSILYKFNTSTSRYKGKGAGAKEKSRL